ncbi:MAG: 2-hydroxyacyl-CoA dehydratase family protein [Promethearchaeota archaeon]|jgi:benzoyl-CoA reductase/2-hydroxyglutaryl-CoA dehydratase subunit BcrC/BadD/HgdB
MQNVKILQDYYLFLKEKKEEGKKVIAFISHDNIPEELIDAAGFIPLRMIFAGNDELMDASHDFLSPSTCAFAQSCIGAFSIKPDYYQFLDLIDYFIVSNHCVSDICASEIITNYFNIARLNFYVSYTKTENSLKYFKIELKDFKKQLEEIKGSQISTDSLKISIKKYNKFKKKLHELSNLNIKGSQKLDILHEALLYGPEVIPKIEEFIRSQTETQSSNNGKSVLLTGCSIFLNDYLSDLIEEGGGNIVFFDTWIGAIYYSQIFDENVINSSENPINLLVHRFKTNFFGDHSVPNFLSNKVSQIYEFCKNYKKKTGKNIGVINHIIKFCDHMSIMSTHLKGQLQSKGIQVLNLERDYSRANRGQLSTRIEAFLEMM